MTVKTEPARSQPAPTQRRPRRSSGDGHGSRWAVGAARVGIIVALALVLEVVVRRELLPANFAAKPTDILRSFEEQIRNGDLQQALRTTLIEAVAALALASSIGFVLGYLLWRFRLLSRAMLPIVNGLFSSPIVLLYPVTLVVFGRTQTAIVVQATVYAMLPVIVYTARSLNEIPGILQRVADVECLSSWQRLTRVMIPSAAPKLSTGIRLGVTYIMISVVSIEFLVQIGGLGNRIQLSALRFDMPAVYAYVIVVVLLSSVLISAVHAVERRVQR